MSNSPCPFLASEDGNGRQRDPIHYPSFENRCLVAEADEALLLADQATFCLSGSCQFCTRYQSALANGIQPSSTNWREGAPTFTQRQPPLVGDRAMPDAEQQPWPSSVEPLDALDEMPFAEDIPPFGVRMANRWYSWAAAALLFFAVVTVGAVFAAYMGWQLALDRLAMARTGQVNTLASAPIEQAVQPYFVVVTTTAMPQTDPAAATLPVTGRNSLEAKDNTALIAATVVTPESFPQAVTATPIVIVPLPTEQVSDTGQTASKPLPADPPVLVQPTPTLVNIALPPAEITPTPVPIINVQVEVPTRRPTPPFDIPTSTPEPLQPTPTETPLPILGTPVIVFAADEASVPPGECTHVRWHVENVRAVYYESLPAFGDGSKEECLRDESDSYALTVTFADGQTKIYTTTVTILWPTPTPSATPSFTPEILPTETWTPLPPTATPTPDVVFGAKLEINGENPYRCNGGSQCNIGVLATNTGDALDTLAIEILASGAWPATVCSQIGTCSSQRLIVANVGPQNTVYTTLQITIPTESVGQQSSYTLRVTSEGSGGTITSQVIELTIESIE